MNTKYILLSLVALLAACSESEDALQNPERAQLTISTEIVTTRASFNTGLQSDVEFKDGNKIGVTLLQEYNVTGSLKAYRLYDKTYNHQAVYAKTGWSLVDKVELGEKAETVVAYYPYTDKDYAFDESQFIQWAYVKMDITSYPHGDGQQDYLWGKSVEDVSSANPHARIQFQHVLPRITFKVTKGDGNANDEIYVRQAFLKEADGIKNVIGTKGSLNIYSGQATMDIDQQTTSLVNGYTAPIQIYPKEVTGEVRTFDFLVFPVSFKEGDVILSIETYKGKNGKLQTYDITLPAATWAAGKQYTYPVIVNIGGEQQQESKPGEKVYMGFNGDNGKPLYWSSWNLGANSPEESGDYYAWGELTPKTVFNWSTYTLCNGTAESCIDIGTNISGTKYDVARNKWGGNWRMPTQNEFKKLLDNCSVSWTYINGVKGIYVKAKSNGNTIFLPAVGCYLSNDDSGKPGLVNYGFYNTGTLSFEYYVSHLVFGETWQGGVPYFSAGYRCEGYPIRPVIE